MNTLKVKDNTLKSGGEHPNGHGQHPKGVLRTLLGVGSGTLCWHNFEHNRETPALRNNASIIA